MSSALLGARFDCLVVAATWNTARGASAATHGPPALANVFDGDASLLA